MRRRKNRAALTRTETPAAHPSNSSGPRGPSDFAITLARRRQRRRTGVADGGSLIPSAAYGNGVSISEPHVEPAEVMSNNGTEHVSPSRHASGSVKSHPAHLY